MWALGRSWNANVMIVGDIERGSKGGVINFDVNQRGRFEPQGNAHGAMSKVEWEEETYGKSC